MKTTLNTTSLMMAISMAIANATADENEMSDLSKFIEFNARYSRSYG